ncbi:hypothetical protein [Prevotella rectalis]|uniref:hypothetical protein n=1 Tax=Prevotella rectalis TaxID=2219999 RepID=UPI0010315193|nr:hypothetical protein [Prevotella brunnea]
MKPIYNGMNQRPHLFLPTMLRIGGWIVLATKATAESRLAPFSKQEVGSGKSSVEDGALTTRLKSNTGKFGFTTNNTHNQVALATLYYSKDSNTFSTTKKLGEADVTNNAFEITTTEPLALVEGNNLFRLACDTEENVADGQKIDATLTLVQLSDGVHAAETEENPEGCRTMKTIIVASVNLENGNTIVKNVTQGSKVSLYTTSEVLVNKYIVDVNHAVQFPCTA